MKKQSMIKGLVMASLMIISAGMIGLQAQNVGDEAPDFEVTLQGGGTFKLSDQEGKVVVIFLFGNTCGPCRGVGPTIEKSIYQEFKSNSMFKAVGLDTWDSSSDESSVTGFRNATGITFPLGIKAQSIATSYGTTYDRLLVVDQKGILVHKNSVPASNDINNVVAAINSSLTATGIEGTAENISIQVYPQPATDKITFKAGGAIGAIRLMDMSGRSVMEWSGGSGADQVSVPVDHLRGGLYIYALEMEGSRLTGKIVIRR